MLTNAGGKRSARAGARPLHRGLRASVALLVVGIIACEEGGGPTVVEPDPPGSIVLTTETSGFMKDDSYELLVDGESRGTIGANDQTTISDLDPATYQVTLGDVSDNCVVEAATVDVASAQEASVSLTVTCAYDDPGAHTLRFGRERPDLDDGGTVTECPFSICSTTEAWDLYVYYSSASTPHSIVRQNQAIGVEIAHLPGVTLDALTEADVAGATFTTDLVADPFDAGRVILIKTDLGNIYALGNPVEDTDAQTLSFDAALVVPAS
jgi:hypothetical protein